MASFTDCKGREWEVRLTLGALTRVREAAGVELGKVLRSEDALADFLFGDLEAFGRALWVLVEDQAAARGVTPEDFAGGIGDGAYRAAVEAVLGSVADFFPNAAALKGTLGRLLATP